MVHKDNWLFSHFESKPKEFLMDDYCDDPQHNEPNRSS
jgi:hypothetical protein